jgi:hypothetical protein
MRRLFLFVVFAAITLTTGCGNDENPTSPQPEPKITPGYWAGNVVKFYVSADGNLVCGLFWGGEMGCGVHDLDFFPCFPIDENKTFSDEFEIGLHSSIRLRGVFTSETVANLTSGVETFT